MADWNEEQPKRIWNVCREKTYSVEVVAWTRADVWHWNVYAYVLDNHPMFHNVDALLHSTPLHGGCTFDERIISEPANGIRYEWQKCREVIKFGSDYAHLGDEHFSACSPEDGIPSQIVDEANELAAYLLECRTT